MKHPFPYRHTMNLFTVVLYISTSVIIPVLPAFAESQNVNFSQEELNNDLEASIINEQSFHDDVSMEQSMSGDWPDTPSSTYNIVDETPPAPGFGGITESLGGLEHANLSTGTSRYTIKAPVLAGRAGLTPTVGITYNSESRENGLVGVGWSIQAGGSVRRFGADFGVPNYDKIEDLPADIFQLSSSVASGQLFENPNDPQSYSTEFESLASITKDESSNEWTVVPRNGPTYIFGGSDNHVVANPNEAITFSSTSDWLLRQVVDQFNNTIDFSWDVSNHHEPHLTLIEYAGRSVEFQYEEDREDKRISFTRGFKSILTKRLDQIVVYAPNDNATGALKLTYNDPGMSPAGTSGVLSQSFLTTVEQKGTNFSDANVSPLRFYYTIKESGFERDDSIAPGLNDEPFLTSYYNYYYPEEHEYNCLASCRALTPPCDPPGSCLCDQSGCEESVAMFEVWAGARHIPSSLTYADLDNDGVPELINPNTSSLLSEAEAINYECQPYSDYLPGTGWIPGCGWDAFLNQGYWSVAVTLPYRFFFNSQVKLQDINGDRRTDAFMAVKRTWEHIDSFQVDPEVTTNGEHPDQGLVRFGQPGIDGLSGEVSFDPDNLPFPVVQRHENGLSREYLPWDAVPSNHLSVSQIRYGRYLDLNRDGKLDSLKMCHGNACGTTGREIFIGDGTLSSVTSWTSVPEDMAFPELGSVASGTPFRLTDLGWNTIEPDHEHSYPYIKSGQLRSGVEDLNGDGLPDLVAYKSTHNNFDGKIYYGHGYGFGSDSEFPWQNMSEVGPFGQKRFWQGDFNADGLVDVLIDEIDDAYEQAGLLENGGTGFGSTLNTAYSIPSDLYGLSHRTATRVADIDGDGLLDLVGALDIVAENRNQSGIITSGICPDGNPCPTGDRIRWGLKNRGPFPGLLNKVVLPTGGSIEFTYKTSTDRTVHKVTNGINELPTVKQLLSRVTTRLTEDLSDPIISSSEFTYYDGRLDHKGKFAGFNRVQVEINPHLDSEDYPELKRFQNTWFENTTEGRYGQELYSVISLNIIADEFVSDSLPGSLDETVHPISYKKTEYLSDADGQAPFWSPLYKTTTRSYRIDDNNALNYFELINEKIWNIELKAVEETRSWGQSNPKPSAIVITYYPANDDNNILLACETSFHIASSSGVPAGEPISSSRTFYPGTLSTDECERTESIPNGTAPLKSTLISHSTNILTEEVRETYWLYDSYGNINCFSNAEISDCAEAIDGSSSKTIITYDTDYSVLPVSEKRVVVDLNGNPSSLNVTTNYNNYLQPEAVTDPIGVTTETLFDALGRPEFTFVTDRNGHKELLSEIEYSNDSKIVTTKTELIKGYGYSEELESNTRVSRVVSDGFGRQIYSDESYLADSSKRCSGTTYNALGQVVAQSTPFFDTTGSICNPDSYDPEATGQAVTVTTYTPEGHIESITSPNGNSNRFEYDYDSSVGGFMVSIINEDGFVERKTWTNALGQTIQVWENIDPDLPPESNPTSYFEYDIFGNLSSFLGADEYESTTYFNAFDEARIEIDPDRSNQEVCTGQTCQWETIYNDQGRASVKIDARGQQIKNHYDSLGNLLCLDVIDASDALDNEFSDCDCYNEITNNGPYTEQENPVANLNTLAKMKDSCFRFDYANGNSSTGQLIKEVNANSVAIYAYDSLGNVNDVTRWICLPRNADVENGSEHDVLCRKLRVEPKIGYTGQTLETKYSFKEQDSSDRFDAWRKLGTHFDDRGRQDRLILGSPEDGVLRWGGGITSSEFDDESGIGALTSMSLWISTNYYYKKYFSYYNLAATPDVNDSGPSFRLKSEEAKLKMWSDNNFSETHFKQDYSYNRRGHINTILRSQDVSTNDQGESWQFAYDGIDRVKTARRDSNPETGDGLLLKGYGYCYSASGNLISKRAFRLDPSADDFLDCGELQIVESSQACTDLNGETPCPSGNNSGGWEFEDVLPGETKFSYGNGAGPHAVTSDGHKLYFYDENGNLIRAGERRIEYNEFNRISKVSLGNILATRHFYGPAGIKVGEIHYETCLVEENHGCQAENIIEDGLHFIFGNSYREVISGASNTAKQKLMLGIAPRQYDLELSVHDSNKERVIVRDQLGSVRRVVNHLGNITEAISYDPYGDIINGEIDYDTSFGFNGMRHNNRTLLNDYNARSQDPSFGRFTQPDYIIPNVINPQDWNRYSYVRNNPVNYIDPSGNFPGLANYAYFVKENSKYKLDTNIDIEIDTEILSTDVEFGFENGFGDRAMDIGISVETPHEINEKAEDYKHRLGLSLKNDALEFSLSGTVQDNNVSFSSINMEVEADEHGRLSDGSFIFSAHPGRQALHVNGEGTLNLGLATIEFDGKYGIGESRIDGQTVGPHSPNLSLEPRFSIPLPSFMNIEAFGNSVSNLPVGVRMRYEQGQKPSYAVTIGGVWIAYTTDK